MASSPDESEGTASPPRNAATTTGVSLRRVGRQHARVVVAIWALLCGIFAWQLHQEDAPVLSGDLDGLLPEEHRAPANEPWLLLSHTGEDSGDDLEAAALAVAQKLGPERVPLAAPAGETESWLDGHAMYLIPPADHEAVGERLTEEALTTAVDGLKALLSSPFFGVAGFDVRRDPLGLRDLRELPDTAGGGWPGKPRITATGDLMSLDGKHLLIQLRSPRSQAQLRADIDEALSDGPVTHTLMGPAARDEAAASRVSALWERTLTLTLAGLTALLALALRRVRPVIAIIATLFGAATAAMLLAPGLGFLTVPLVVLALGFGCEGALHLTRISIRGWPAAAVLGSALLPLLLTNYPVWRGWSVVWLGLVGFTVLAVRLVVPAILELLRGSAEWSRRGFLLAPMPVLAVLLSAGLLGGGAWAAQHLRYQPTPDLGPSNAPDADATMAEAFFDPRRVAEVRTAGVDGATALELASDDARVLATLVPESAHGIESPGLLVLPSAELDRRKASLGELNLAERMLRLREILLSRGFRPDAFGEFLSTAADLGHVPTARSALEGPLGPWIERYLVEDGDQTAVRARVFLGADPGVATPRLAHEDGRIIDLVGPVVASRDDRRGFRDWLGILAVSQLWLGALFVWLGTRQLSVAVAAAFCGLTTQSALILALLGLRIPLGPALVPAFLLVGAAAVVAAGRSCRAVDTREPLSSGGPLLAGAAQIVAGLALVASGEPLWAQVGAVVAIGAAFGWGVGLFVAPGMSDLLRRVNRGAS